VQLGKIPLQPMSALVFRRCCQYISDPEQYRCGFLGF